MLFDFREIEIILQALKAFKGNLEIMQNILICENKAEVIGTMVDTEQLIDRIEKQKDAFDLDSGQ